MSMSLSYYVYQKTEQKLYPIRMWDSVCSITKNKGYVAGGATICTITSATVVSFALSYFCMEGTVRSFMEVEGEGSVYSRIRPLGDVGGWASLALFSTMALKSLVETLLKEGEYLKLDSMCQKFVELHKNLDDPDLLKNLYPKINDLLDVFSTQCLFSKHLISRRLSALDIYQKTSLEDNNKTFAKDTRLQNIFLKINSKLEKKTSCRQYFHRVYEGQKAIHKKGYLKQSISIIVGIAIPLIFIANAIFSIVGEVGLGYELFVNRSHLADTGHFGEWPINAIEAISAVYFLHLLYILNEGDFAIAHHIYSKEIMALKNDTKLHNRLCNVANEQLAEMSSTCHYLKHPHENKFEKL